MAEAALIQIKIFREGCYDDFHNNAWFWPKEKLRNFTDLVHVDPVVHDHVLHLLVVHEAEPVTPAQPLPQQRLPSLESDLYLIIYKTNSVRDIRSCSHPFGGGGGLHDEDLLHHVELLPQGNLQHIHLDHRLLCYINTEDITDISSTYF